jgi:hypothetical protein
MTQTNYALLDGREVVKEIGVRASRGKNGWIEDADGDPTFINRSRLTPLCLVQIQESGEAREIGEPEPQPTGNESYRMGVVNQGLYANNDAADDLEQRKEIWQSAQSRLRCLPVLFRGASEEWGDSAIPGKLFLAHEVENRFVVVKRWEEKP